MSDLVALAACVQAAARAAHAEPARACLVVNAGDGYAVMARCGDIHTYRQMPKLH